MSSPTDLLARLAKIQTDLLLVQASMSEIQLQRAADPFLESSIEERFKELSAQRELLLSSWARLLLHNVLSGGSVALCPIESDTPAETDTTEAADPPVEAVEAEPAEPAVEEPVAEEPVAEEPPPDPLQAILSLLGEPTELTEAEAVSAEQERLDAATNADAVAAWPDFSKTTQRTLLGLLVARMRHMQSELPAALSPSQQRLEEQIAALGAHSKQLKVGFVFGLSAAHRPVTGTWLSDARRWWTSLSAETKSE